MECGGERWGRSRSFARSLASLCTSVTVDQREYETSGWMSSHWQRRKRFSQRRSLMLAIGPAHLAVLPSCALSIVVCEWLSEMYDPLLMTGGVARPRHEAGGKQSKGGARGEGSSRERDYMISAIGV